MLETRYLKLVETISKFGTLKRASEELFLSQSALSHQLRQLEDQLGVAIFQRTNTQLRFTPAGEAFLQSSRVILEQLERLEQRIKDEHGDQLAHYVHGFSAAERQRLSDQASAISEVLHFDSHWPAGARVLEVGCGTGSQTRILAEQNPETQFVAIDLSATSLRTARREVDAANVTFERADLFQLPYPDSSFDHVFVCFVLEHLREPMAGLAELKRVLRPRGTLTVIEGDHGSTYFHPDSAYAKQAIEAQVRLQAMGGGNANIGRQLNPLLQQAGFASVEVSPRQVYVDDSKPTLKEGFVRNTFVAMIRGIAEAAQDQKIISRQAMTRGLKELLQTAESGGTFCYTFFKGVGVALPT